jgi:hypothetical protein
VRNHVDRLFDIGGPHKLLDKPCYSLKRRVVIVWHFRMAETRQVGRNTSEARSKQFGYPVPHHAAVGVAVEQ